VGVMLSAALRENYRLDEAIATLADAVAAELRRRPPTLTRPH